MRLVGPWGKTMCKCVDDGKQLTIVRLCGMKLAFLAASDASPSEPL